MTGRRIDRPSGGTHLPTTLFALFLLAGALPVQAQVTANLRLEQINGGCFVNSQETIFQGDPDRYFRLGIFDSTAAPVLAACSTACTGDATPGTQDGSVVDRCTISTGCALYDPADQTLSKVIPNLSGAYFYIGLWDDDDLPDADDSLGDHWLFASARFTSVAPANNNLSPYRADNPIAFVCGDDVEGLGDPGNFNPRYSIWFTDQSAPVAGSNVRLEDDGVVTAWENDLTMTFFWTQASDPDSGVSHLVDLFSVEDGFLCSSMPSSPGSASFCSSGCTCAGTPVHGRIYSFRAGGRNGVFPVIDSPATSMSSYIQVAVDLVSPVTAITAPPTGAWRNAAFVTSFSDTDSGAGVAPASCVWGAISSGLATRTAEARTCSSGVTVSVGAGADCRHEGANTCVVNGRSTDQARRLSATGQRAFSIDWTADAVTGLEAFTEAAGAAIAASTWQRDTTPYFTWTASTSTAPIAGYSFALDAAPDCIPDTSSLSYGVPPGLIDDGQHLFRIRAVDAAGNCGTPATFSLYVDTVGDSLTGLQAYTENGGVAIASGDWTQDRDPFFTWSVPSSTSPIDGYSWAVDALPDCIVDTTSSAYSFPADALADGMHVFQLRPRDAAGNCGIVSTYLLNVDTVAESITGLQAYTEPGGATIPAMTWQPDNDPHFDWTAPASTSPIAGYSFALDASPDCLPETTSPSYTFPADSVGDGINLFRVRPIDEAGNCGPDADFEIWVYQSQGMSPGRIPGTLDVHLDPIDPTRLELVWAPSCGALATDYAVYEGTLGTWYSHSPAECTTFGAATIDILPGAGNRYFLVVPLSLSEEGSYGTASGGAERPAGVISCLPQAPPVPCP